MFITAETNGNSSGLNFEIAPATWTAGPNEPSPPWCSDESTSVADARGSSIGSGDANTAAMVRQCRDGAATAATSYRGGGRTDWFLPSKDELNQALVNAALIGDLRSDKYSNYWTSTEDSGDSQRAWTQMILTGDQTTDPKGYGYFVRPVRAFRTSGGAPSAEAVAAPSTKTMIRLYVNGCEGCTVGVQRGIEFGNPNNIRPAKPAYWEGMQAVVINGFVAFEVTTRYTPGMSFTVRAPWEVDGASITNIILGSTEPAGATVSSTAAKKTRMATACWAGTTLPEVTIYVQVTKAAGFGYTDSAVSARAWASPTVATIGPLQEATRGRLGNQDAYYC